MSQRLKSCPNSMNLETLACEKYLSRLMNKEKPMTPSTIVQRCRERMVKPQVVNQSQLGRVRPTVKQQNFPSPKRGQSPNKLQYTDDSALVEVTVKTTNPRQRSRSTTVEREPWGQLLKQQKSGDKLSLFGNFDPLRTLHFLAKELQYQLQTLLPDDSNIQQMVTDIQHALKRVPPEVASSVHLQQAIELLPSRKNSKSDSDKPERLKPVGLEKFTQTPSSNSDKEDYEKLQKVMEDSTLKLEASCKQMENLCIQLKYEKDDLEKQLQAEKYCSEALRKKIDDLEIENNDILTPRIKALEEDKARQESEFKDMAKKLENQAVVAAMELKEQLTDMKNSKTVAEQECAKLRHQIKLSTIEKEKFIAILAVRDKQICEIRSEMTQLQEVVNDQLLELHSNAYQSMPSTGNAQITGLNGKCENKENIGDIGDGTLSTIYSNEEQMQHFYAPQSNNSFRDLPSGDIDTSNILQDMPDSNPIKNVKYQKKEPLERPDSQASIRSMFSEIKKTAYAVASTPRERSQFNLIGNVQ